MIDTQMIERVTRLLAYMLRHQPGEFDLDLDKYGYAEIEDVLHALAERTGEDFEEGDIAEAIDSGDRPRYEIVDGRIRALYGHSIEIDPGETAEPPEELYVALPARDRERMERYGLRGGRRRFLHLSLTPEEAQETGRRAAVEYLVIKVTAVDAWEQGVDFYDRKSIWLAPELPTYALDVVGEYEDGSDPEERRRGRGTRPASARSSLPCQWRRRRRRAARARRPPRSGLPTAACPRRLPPRSPPHRGRQRRCPPARHQARRPARGRASTRAYPSRP